MPKRIYMRELSKQIDRNSHTIRGWERDKILPRGLVPHRDDKGWRYWTDSQVVKMKEWMGTNGMAPGKGLSGFTPSVEKVQEMMTKLREPRDLELVKCPQCDRSVKNLTAHVRFAHKQ
jgi:hypothetical protein